MYTRPAMNGVHDMGGMHGFGRVEREEGEPVFHEPWEGRAYAMRRQLGPLGGGRPAVERLEPAVYLASSYYEKWLRAAENTLVEHGVVTAEELDARTEHFRTDPAAAVPTRDDPEQAKKAVERIHTLVRPGRDVGIEPAFAVGDRVRVRNINPPGHTRLPRYVRGKRGVVARFHGVHDVQDAVAPGVTPPPQPVYNVQFEASELWGEAAEANQRLYVDMWESYIEPA